MEQIHLLHAEIQFIKAFDEMRTITVMPLEFFAARDSYGFIQMEFKAQHL